MADVPLDLLDVTVLVILLLGTIAYLTKGTVWSKKNGSIDAYNKPFGPAAKAGKTRNLVKKMEESDKNMVILYGSQTGTAEDYASRLAKEGSARFGMKSMVADLEDYDFDNLDSFPQDKVAIFVLATYGEGEPTDNAVEFYEFIYNSDPTFSENLPGKPLSNLRYVIFGLGNNTYEHYNAMVRRIDEALIKFGAKRVGPAGEGDDGAGTMEEDFLAWKETMWKELQEEMGLEEREAVYEPVFSIIDRLDLTPDDNVVYLGERNKNHLEGKSVGPYNSHNPFIAPIKLSKECFTIKGRNCIHMEIDLSNSNLTFTTGDHLAVWPTNAGAEVDRLFKVLGIMHQRNNVVDVKGLDSTSKVPFPTPTTYDAILRYHIEICAPVSRQYVASLASFAPTDAAKEQMTKLGGDKEYFQEYISQRYLNIAQVLEIVAPGQVWFAIPFSIIIEGLNHIQPRYYSISSSSLINNKVPSITAVIESINVPGGSHVLKGVTTNYLLALKQKQCGDPDPNPHGLTYAISGPRNKYNGIHVPVHVRSSNFRLPSDPLKPVIMIGPGTGVAPFRGFVQERAAIAEQGEKVGQTMLFFGCRKESEDFLYKDEWKVGTGWR
jgi:NADPH-ferrihemoprotein reductase